MVRHCVWICFCQVEVSGPLFYAKLTDLHTVQTIMSISHSCFQALSKVTPSICKSTDLESLLFYLL